MTPIPLKTPGPIFIVELLSQLHPLSPASDDDGLPSQVPDFPGLVYPAGNETNLVGSKQIAPRIRTIIMVFITVISVRDYYQTSTLRLA